MSPSSLPRSWGRERVWLLGHSSGGLVAAYAASQTDLCERLVLEDPPLFSSQGERRRTTFYRRRHPDSDLRMPFWPEVGQAAYKGMNSYGPRFGEAFYDDSFHGGIPHEDILGRIRCATVLMKARTDVSQDGILLAALTDDDAERASRVVPDCEVLRFDCGHGIHAERPEEFLRCMLGADPGS